MYSDSHDEEQRKCQLECFIPCQSRLRLGKQTPKNGRYASGAIFALREFFFCFTIVMSLVISARFPNMKNERIMHTPLLKYVKLMGTFLLFELKSSINHEGLMFWTAC